MGKASSSKKVARAAKVGATSGPNESRQLGFPALVLVIVVLGFSLVAAARTTRDAQPSPTLQDHWHNAYGVYDCRSESFLAPFQSEFDPQGVHSHKDTTIHIHPFTAAVTGKEAKLKVFLDAMGATLSDETLTLPGGETLEEGVDCGGEPAVLQVVRWDNALNPGEPSEVRTEDLDQFRFLANAQALTIALAPAGSEIPLPDVAALEASVGVSSRDDISTRDSVSVPGPQDFGTDTEDE